MTQKGNLSIDIGMKFCNEVITSHFGKMQDNVEHI